MRKLILGGLFLTLVGCAGELTNEKAAEAIGAQSEFSEPFCAPLHLAPLVLTGENHADPNVYLQSKFGALVDAGLVETQLGGKNSWRTMLRVNLTDKGRELCDQKRTQDDMFYVQVCGLRVDSILSLQSIGAGDTVLCRYRIVQQNLTPFGVHLGFMEGKQHVHERKFVQGTFGWDLLPIEEPK